MKKQLSRALCVGLLLLAGACAHHAIIPDDTLAKIFRDAFLANAYIDETQLHTDSLNIYEPIFARYGYTTADVQYTIGNFSKRKSARLGDVVERAIVLLDDEGKVYNHEVAILDTIDNVARRTFTQTLRTDSLIRIRSLRDTSKLRIRLDVEPGDYTVSLRYKIDSADLNENSLRGNMWFDRKDGSRSGNYTAVLRRNREESFLRKLTADSDHRHLYFEFPAFSRKPQRPSIDIYDLKIEYTPPAAEAVERLYEKQLDIRIFADGFFRAAIPTDSL